MQKSVLALLSLLAVAISGCGYPMLLRPSYDTKGTPGDLGFEYEELMLDEKVSCWIVRSEEATSTIVIFPGSDANKSFYLPVLNIFIPRGYNVILLDYIGFGESQRVIPSFMGLIETSYIVMDYTDEHFDSVILFGASIGASVISNVAQYYDNVDACIFDGTVDLRTLPAVWLDSHSIDFWPLYIATWAWATPQVPVEMWTKETIKNVKAPKLFIHSIDDEVAPYADMLAIFDNAPEPKWLWTVDDYGHGRVGQEDPERYIRNIDEFLTNYGI